MTITVAAIAIGLVIGLSRGGRLRNLTRVDLRWSPLAVFGLAAITWAHVGHSEAPELLYATGLLVLGAAAVRNLRIVGLGVVGLGLLANAAPLLANGTVPVDAEAAVHAGLIDPGAPLDGDLGTGRHLADSDTLLAPLGRTIPVPELGAVLSFGDLLVAVGLADAVNTSLRRRRPGGVPVAEIFAADEQAAAGTVAGRLDDAVRRRERPVEVRPGQPVPVPMGWGRPPDDGGSEDLAPAGLRRGPRARSERAGAHPSSTTHVPWPWRRTPPPRPLHPTMRVGRDAR